VGELADKLAEMTRALTAPDLIWPVLLKPACGLPWGEPIPTRPEMAKEEVQPLLGIQLRFSSHGVAKHHL
jgi:hypothetical protein